MTFTHRNKFMFAQGPRCDRLVGDVYARSNGLSVACMDATAFTRCIRSAPHRANFSVYIGTRKADDSFLS